MPKCEDCDVELTESGLVGLVCTKCGQQYEWTPRQLSAEQLAAMMPPPVSRDNDPNIPLARNGIKP